MNNSSTYHIGKAGTPWGSEEKAQWLAETTIKRSYLEQVVTKIDALKDKFDITQYGALSYAPEKYPLFSIKTRNCDENKPTVLITGGIHGYETSGVHGALAFMALEADNYSSDFNILVAPCVSPWGYETINRWNPNAVDPNRSFVPNSPAEESAALMQLVQDQKTSFLAHIDLHETTDTDESEFRPALAARDGKEYIEDSVPDGFYVVGDTENPQDAFQTAIIDEVRHVTHIAPPDDNGNIIGEAITQEGVINYPLKALGLCASVTDAAYTSTTEVYPDSPRVTEEECNMAQVAAIKGALDYLKQHAK
ncbi:M14 family metallopeptidase [Photobacterium leiognathi]|uniref:M14 family metallopeptidase n=1 Tax=Photobacterium leiognathi TaxID=553611 RepID=UPI00298283D9|nr:M14 family metallocarboxypeptidase [Photobacterium leiognathi]